MIDKPINREGAPAGAQKSNGGQLTRSSGGIKKVFELTKELRDSHTHSFKGVDADTAVEMHHEDLQDLRTYHRYADHPKGGKGKAGVIATNVLEAASLGESGTGLDSIDVRKAGKTTQGEFLGNKVQKRRSDTIKALKKQGDAHRAAAEECIKEASGNTEVWLDSNGIKQGNITGEVHNNLLIAEEFATLAVAMERRHNHPARVHGPGHARRSAKIRKETTELLKKNAETRRYAKGALRSLAAEARAKGVPIESVRSKILWDAPEVSSKGSKSKTSKGSFSKGTSGHTKKNNSPLNSKGGGISFFEEKGETLSSQLQEIRSINESPAQYSGTFDQFIEEFCDEKVLQEALADTGDSVRYVMVSHDYNTQRRPQFSGEIGIGIGMSLVVSYLRVKVWWHNRRKRRERKGDGQEGSNS